MNPLLGEVPLVLDKDTTLTLKMGINALCIAEPILGMKTRAILDDLEDPHDGPSLNTLRALVWAGLREHHPDYHLFQIGDLMQSLGPQLFQNAVLDGLASAFGKSEGKKGGNPSEAPEEDWDWLKLHQRWCEAGFHPDSFWRQTPRTVRSALTGHLDRVRREQRTALEMAWHNARWASFCQSLEPLSEILRQTDAADESEDVNWHRMKVWAMAFGQVIEEV